MALKGFHVEKVTVFWGWTASLVDTFIRLGVFLPRISYWKNKNKKQKRFLMLFIVSAPKCCPDMFFPLFVFLRCTFHFVRGPVLSTADPAFYLSYLIFIFSDIWSILPPCFKKSLLKEKEIKQLWFLRCMVVSVNSLCHIKKKLMLQIF